LIRASLLPWDSVTAILDLSSQIVGFHVRRRETAAVDEAQSADCLKTCPVQKAIVQEDDFWADFLCVVSSGEDHLLESA